MPFQREAFKREFPRAVKFALKKVAVMEVAMTITVALRAYIGGKTRQDIDKGEAQTIVMMLLASIPPEYRERAFLAIEEMLEDGPLRHSWLSDILVALVESTDDGVRDFMKRENLSQEEAMAFVRDEIVLDLASKIPYLRTKLAARKAAEGTPVAKKTPTPPAHDDHGPKPAPAEVAKPTKAGLDPAKLLKFTKLQYAMFMAVMGKAIDEVLGDSPDYAKFLGMANQAVDGAKILIDADTEGFIKLLPSKEDGTIDRALVDEVRADPFLNNEALELIRLCVFTSMSKGDRWLSPQNADLADSIFNFSAFKAWVKERRDEVVEGVDAARDGVQAAGDRIRQPPEWVKRWEPTANWIWQTAKRWDINLAKTAGICTLAGVACLVTGTIGLVTCSAIAWPGTWPWVFFWILLAIGVPLLFVARIIMSLFDTQLTFLARAVQAVPLALKDTLAALKITPPEGERDKTTSRWSSVIVGRDNATMVTILASLGEIVVTVIAAAGMLMAFAAAGVVSSAGVIAMLLVITNVTKAFAFVMGEATVRERLRMLEPAATSQELKLREKREKRSWMLALAGGVGAATSFAAMCLVALTGTAVVVSHKAEAADTAAREQECREVIIPRLSAARETYAKTALAGTRGEAAYCLDVQDGVMRNDPDCFACDF